jgi:hypothetical protein
MRSSVFSLTRLTDDVLLRNLATIVARDRGITAVLLAHIAEVDVRRLHVPAGYASMHAYCVEELHLSEDAASKRIQAARAARRFPALFQAVAEGRIHLAGVCLLAPHLTPGNADELLAAASGQRKSAIEQFLARRFTAAGAPTRAERAPVLRPLPRRQLAPGQVEAPVTDLLNGLAPSPSETTVTPPGDPPAAAPHSPEPSQAAPVAPERFLLQLAIPRRTYDKLQHARALLGHSVPSGDVAQVLDRALDVLVQTLEGRKFAATDRPRPRIRARAQAGAPEGLRVVPAQVRRAVWARDQGRCNFVGDGGHRCGARAALEFDHVDPVARGGRPSVAGMRLRCRAHNQYEAERLFGTAFMMEKRDRARRDRVAASAAPAMAAGPAEAAGSPSRAGPGGWPG